MKKQILYLLFIAIYSISFGQVPTTNLESHYKFTNGGLLDDTSNVALTQTGSASTLVSDAAGVANNAINLGGDYFRRSSTAFNDFSISFGIKTSQNNGVKTTIIDQSPRVADAEGAGRGWYIYLQNGKVGIAGNFSGSVSPRGSGPNYTGTSGYISTESTTNISDNNWHHVVITADEIITRGTTATFWRFKVEYKVYVDGVLEATMSPQIMTSIRQSNSPWAENAVLELSTGKDISIATNDQTTITNVYNDEIDEILIYSKVLNSNEIGLISDATGFCFAPDDDNFSITSASGGSIDIDIVGSLTYDIAYHKSSEPFSNALFLNNVSSGTSVISGLDQGTEYSIYYRKQCANGSFSAYSNAKTALTQIVKYVDVDATGANDGTSWADAYTDLSTALSSGTNSVFWIAEGTYKTNGTESSSFIIDEHQGLYGGFNGTETDITQRDVLANPVVLSGDIDGDDASAALDFSNTNLQANNERLVWVEGDNVIIDGLTISGGFADSATDANRRSGSALYLSQSSNNVTVNNVVFEKNIATNGGTVYFNQLQTQSGNFNYTFTNCTFRNNLANHSVVMYASNPRNSGGAVTTTKFINCLMYDNVIEDNGSLQGVNSLFWFRADVGSGVNNAEIINSTITNNTFNGSSNNQAGLIAASRLSGSANVKVYNSIFFQNFESNSTSIEKKVVNTWSGQGAPNTVIARNTLDLDDFSNWTDKQNIITSDPLFADVTNNNYSLSALSPALDQGDNTLIASSINTDLLGRARFINTTIDLGALEFDPTAPINRTLTTAAANGTIAADVAPTNGTYTDGTVVELTATPATGYQFDGWSGDASGTTNPLSVTMDADKSITALFSQIERTLTLNSSTGAIQTSGIPNSVSGNSQTHNDGTVVELTALPDTNYQFDGWSGDASGTDNPLSVTMDADKTITAMFSLVQQTLTTTAANGTIGVDIAPTNGTYDIGTVVELTATPDVGYQFDGWSGDASGTDNPLSVTINADKNITALFSPIQRKLTRTEINGFISVNIPATNEIYDNGTVLALTATPAIGYQFDGWSGDASGTDNPLSVTMDADKNITALFSLIPIQRTLTLAIPRIGGTVTRDISPINGTYEDGTVVELTATPAIGYQFDGWSGDASGTDTPLSVTMDADKNITAMFSLIPIQRTLVIQLPDGPSGGVAPGTVTRDVNPTNGTYTDGSVVVLTAVPGVGYQFDGWSGDASGTDNPLSITMDADKNITAMFSLIPIQRTLVIQLPDGPSGGVAPGTVTRDVNPTNGTYTDGSVVVLTAVPGVGYQFDGWSGDASGTDNPLSITMDADKTIAPIFSLDATASVVDDAFNNAINVYPNPVTSSLQITLAIGEELKKVQVFNLIGKKVVETKSSIINFNELSKGVYIVKIENSNGKVAVRKVVKR